MKLVIFDCDGTLVDSQHAICAAMEHAFGTLDLRAPSRREMLGVVGLSLPQVFAVLAGDQPESVQAELIRLYRAYYPGTREGAAAHEPLYDGIGEAVHTLARRDDVVLGIAKVDEREGFRVVAGRGEMEPLAPVHAVADAIGVLRGGR